MERRLKLCEKLKATKLNKLTVKQGGVDVKLNLKKDLIDPNVSIDDKVLEMLEKYVGAEKLSPTEVVAAGESSSKKPEEPKEKIIAEQEKQPVLAVHEPELPVNATKVKHTPKSQQGLEDLVDKNGDTSHNSIGVSSPTKRVRFDLNSTGTIIATVDLISTPETMNTTKNVEKNPQINEIREAQINQINIIDKNKNKNEVVFILFIKNYSIRR